MKLYTTHCSKCNVLQKKLDAKGKKYDIEENVKIMQELGITSLPVLEVDGELKKFEDAIKYVNSL